MLAKEIKYVDFNGKERTETFYFNISIPELIKWQVHEGYGLDQEITKLTKSEDLMKSIEIFQKLIDYSIGIKSEDGKRLIKNEGQVAREFKETNAYEVLYMELGTNDKKASEFINAIMPKLTEEQKKEIQQKVEAQKVQQVNTISN